MRLTKADLMPAAAALDIAISVLEADPGLPGDVSIASVNRSLVWLRKLRSMALASASKITVIDDSPQG